VLPLGYRKYNGDFMADVPQIPGVPDGTLARAWQSPDGKYDVYLINLTYIQDRAPGALGYASYGHELAGYLLGIDQVKDLPPDLQKKVDSSAH
jgi:hypothetical protein